MSLSPVAISLSVIVVVLASFLVAVSPIYADSYSEFCAAFTRELEVGDEGEDVKRLQSVLQSEGFGSLPATGFYGPLTAEAVRKFQRSKGILPTGNIGPITFSSMRIAWCGESGGSPTHPVDSNLLFAHVTSGNPYYVYWVSAGMSSCTLDGSARPIYGIESFSSGATRSHLVTCTGTQGSLTRSVTYGGSGSNGADGGMPGKPQWDNSPKTPTTGTAPYGTFTASQDYVKLDNPSSQATLTWDVSNALACTISATGESTHSISPSGTLSVRPAQTTTYTLSCTGASSPYTSHRIGSATVFVTPAKSPGSDVFGGTTGTTPTDTNGSQWDDGQPGGTGSYLRSVPTSIQVGASASLTWATKHTNASCRLSGGSYNNLSVASSGNLIVNPLITTTYTLLCVDAFTLAELSRSTATVTVTSAFGGSTGTPTNGLSCSAGEGNGSYPHGTTMGSCTLRQLILRVGSCSPSEQPTYTCTNGKWFSPSGIDFCTLYGC